MMGFIWRYVQRKLDEVGRDDETYPVVNLTRTMYPKKPRIDSSGIPEKDYSHNELSTLSDGIETFWVDVIPANGGVILKINSNDTDKNTVHLLHNDDDLPIQIGRIITARILSL